MLRVSWTAKKTNDRILEKIGVTDPLLSDMKRRKLRYFGREHVIEKPGDCLVKKISYERHWHKTEEKNSLDIMA